MPNTQIGEQIAHGLWIAIAATIVATGVLFHALLPRYEFASLGEQSEAYVFDRWTGAFQRVTYDASGEPKAATVVRPF